MKVTTVRFGTDLWRFLEAEANHVGVSVSQYVREAALARAAAASAARGDDPLVVLGEMSPPPSPEVHANPAPTGRSASLAVRYADVLRSDAEALVAQSRQAIRHADQLIRHRDEMTDGRHARPAEREPQE